MTIMRIRTVLTGTVGLPGLNTFYANGASSTPITADATDMVARVRAFWNAIVATLPTAMTAVVSPQVDLIDPATGALTGGLVGATPLTVTGTGGTALPLASMALLVASTGTIVNGRRLQGRSFIGPLAATVNNLGSLGPAQGAVISSAATNMLTGTTSSVPVVWHRPKLPGPAGGSVAPVTGFVTRTPFAVLRSRRD